MIISVLNKMFLQYMIVKFSKRVDKLDNVIAPDAK